MILNRHMQMGKDVDRHNVFMFGFHIERYTISIHKYMHNIISYNI